MTITTSDEHDLSTDDPPAAHATATPAWLNLVMPLTLAALVLSVIALVVAITDDDGTTVASSSGASATVGGAASGAEATDVEMGEFFFEIDPSAIAADTAVAVSINNGGAIEHDFAVLQAGADPSGEADLADLVLTDLGNVAPGDTVDGTLELAPATYLVVCLVPGHFDAGMSAELTAG